MQARDVMTSPAITVHAETPAQAAAALLVAHGFTAAPVLDAGERLIGIVTEADLVRGRVLPEGWGRGRHEEHGEPLVGAVMTQVPLAVRPEDDLADVVSLMLEGHVRSVPIVDDGELVGILTRRDVLRCIARGELTSQDVHRRRSVE